MSANITVKETRTICCYCGVGCGVIVQSESDLQGERITGVRGDPEHPANFGKLCTKGTTLHLARGGATRLLYPELRSATDALRARVGWGPALDLAAERFAAIIREHGPDAVAFYISGQLLTEDYYVFNKLVRSLAGTNNIDTNSRLCMSSAVTGYKLALGADAPPACYEDLELADCVLIAGSNAAWAHPVAFGRVLEGRQRNRDARLIVIDPRRTETAAQADLHLAIAPGSDIALFNSMLQVMLEECLVDRAYIAAHTEGFETLETVAREYPPAVAARICGVPAEAIRTAARWFGRARAALSLYCQGLNQSAQGTHNNAALIHLHLATGQIGRPGAGPFSLTGQPNAMGGRESGGMASLLPGHRDPANPAHRGEVARYWGVPALPDRRGKTAVELFDAVATGEIKAVWIACTNPAQSLPDQSRVRAALERAEFVVLQEAFRNTETARYADLLLPASSWGEKEGTVTNSERRISRVRAAIAPPGEARADWAIAAEFAQRLAAKLDRADEAQRFAFTAPEQAFNEHRGLTLGRDLDIGGISYALLEQRGPQQWPFPEGATRGRARLYADGRYETPSGRARFTEVRHAAPADPVDAAFPLALTTGRLRDQWHGMSRTATVARLSAAAPEPVLEMHPADMRSRAIADGDAVRVRGRRGELLLQALASEACSRGLVYLPMHWGSSYMAGLGTNVLTSPAFDPFSRQPELKHAAVQVEGMIMPHELFACARLDGVSVEALQDLLPRFELANLALFGRDSGCVRIRARAAQPFDAKLLADLDAALGMTNEHALRYEDAAQHVSKRALWRASGLAAVRLAGEARAAAWIEDAMGEGWTEPVLRHAVLAPLVRAPSARPARGRAICTCHDVAENEIAAAFARGLSLPEVQRELRCGTGCGTCVPDLKRLEQAGRVAA